MGQVEIQSGRLYAAGRHAIGPDCRAVATGAGLSPALRPEKLRPEKLRPEKLRPEKLRPEKLRPEKLRPEKRRPTVLGFAVAALALTSAGCAAERTLIITSEPPGALVRLDDDLVGETPVEVPFLHYGTRRVTFYLDGHRTRSFLIEVKAPWYGRFPIDLVSEILIPVGWKDRKRVHTELEPSDQPTDVPTQRSVFDRAEVLRRAGPNGPREMPPIEVVPALPQPTDPAGDGAPPTAGGAGGSR